MTTTTAEPPTEDDLDDNEPTGDEQQAIQQLSTEDALARARRILSGEMSPGESVEKIAAKYGITPPGNGAAADN